MCMDRCGVIEAELKGKAMDSKQDILSQYDTLMVLAFELSD